MIDNVIDFIKTIRDLNSKCKSDEILFYRGENSCHYKETTPKLWRNKTLDLEYNEYQRIMMECPEYFDKKDHLGTITMMRHYGACTRLLDITTNPLVALCFACQKNNNNDGKVIVYKTKKSEVLYHTSDKALMLSCLPLFRDDEQNEIKAFCEKHRDMITDDDIKKSKEMKRLLHEIRHECPAFETEIVGEDLLKSYFVLSHKFDKRMKSQSGAYIIVGLDYKNYEKINKSAEIVKVSTNAKQEILKELNMMGISVDRLYMDLENMITNYYK